MAQEVAAGLVFGPVPSRRLGKSLGVNNIPPKVCSYSCVYCQLGRTKRLSATRQAFYSPTELLNAVKTRLAELAPDQRPDYLTFVPDGEPTLDINLGKTIELLKPLKIPIAVISNASLMSDPDVRDALLKADWVSLKLDAIDEQTWRQIDRAHKKISFKAMLDGILQFAKAFSGFLATETMLVKGINDSAEQVRPLAEFLAKVSPTCAYISVPIRPPAEPWVQPPAEQALTFAYQTFAEKLACVELITGFEGYEFAVSTAFERELLSILAVHPIRHDALERLIEKANVSWEVIDNLLNEGKIVSSVYRGSKFYSLALSRIKK